MKNNYKHVYEKLQKLNRRLWSYDFFIGFILNFLYLSPQFMQLFSYGIVSLEMHFNNMYGDERDSASVGIMPVI